LDELPLPDKDLFYKKLPYLQSRYPIMTSRGCPFACTFCCNNLLRQFYQGQGTYLRRRSPGDVMKELIEAVGKYDIKEVIFYDDSFILDKEWLSGFLQEYKEKIKKPFHCYSIAKYLTPDVIELLKNCGYCAFIEIGIQSVNDKIRREICNRQDDNEQIAEVARQLHQAGIEMLVDHIIGFPGEGGQSQIEAAKFYNRIRPNIINSFWLTYYPKLKIVEISQKYGLLSAQDVENIEEGRFKFTDVQRSYNLNRIKDIREIKKVQTLFNIIPYLPAKFNDFLINKKIYKILPTGNFFRISLRKILLITSRKKYRIAAIKKLKRYFYFMTWRKI
jgi:pyruvate-formate lyase-activating enzyme